MKNLLLNVWPRGYAWVDITCMRRLFAGVIMPGFVTSLNFIATLQILGIFMIILEKKNQYYCLMGKKKRPCL